MIAALLLAIASGGFIFAGLMILWVVRRTIRKMIWRWKIKHAYRPARPSYEYRIKQY
jgi:hypothetical protein